MLRFGEALGARRLQLLLPVDVEGTHDFALFSIEEPKTRFRAARHQSVKIDQPELLRIICLCFEGLEPHHRLWPFSGQSLRARFRQLCQAFSGRREALPRALIFESWWHHLVHAGYRRRRDAAQAREMAISSHHGDIRAGSHFSAIFTVAVGLDQAWSSLTRPSTIAYGSRPSIGTFFSPLVRVRERTDGWFDGALAITV